MTSRIGVVLRTLTAFPDVSVDFRGLSKISSYAWGLQLKLKTLKVEKKNQIIFYLISARYLEHGREMMLIPKIVGWLVLYALTVIR